MIRELTTEIKGEKIIGFYIDVGFEIILNY
jgi:hypothetical protein